MHALQKLQDRPSRYRVVVTAEAARSGRQRTDRERIPAAEHLVVQTRPHALAANLQQLPPRAGEGGVYLFEPQPLSGSNVFEARAEAQMPAPLDIRCCIEPEAQREHRPFLRCQRLLQLLRLPQVVAALVTLGIGIQARTQ